MLWKGARVTLTYAPELGAWTVISSPPDWLEIWPLDPAGQCLARLGTHGKLWVQRKDVTRLPDQQEQLL